MGGHKVDAHSIENRLCTAHGDGGDQSQPGIGAEFLKDIPVSYTHLNICGETQKIGLPQLSMVYTPAQIREITDRARQGRTGKSAVKRKSWESGIGHISMEYAYVYPPGIPLIVPGERISQEAVLCLQRYREAGFQIEGLKEENEIEVWHSE